MKRIKQMLALTLCVCMIAAGWPVEATQAAETSDVITYSLNEAKTTTFASSYFSTETKYQTALGSFAGHANAIPWADSGLVSAEGQKNAFFQGVSYGYVSGMQNYTASADVVTTQTTGNVAVMAYSRNANNSNSNSYGYEFNILGIDGGQTFRLNRRLNTQVYTLAPTAGNNNGVAITEFFPSYTVGQTITIGINAVTKKEGNVVLNCYATLAGETKTIFENIIDDTSSKITSGAPGIKINKANATVTRVAISNEAGASVFEDTFSVESNYKNALGNFAEHSNAATWTESGLISSSGQKNAFFYGALQQCMITADVVTTQTSGNAALMVFSQNANSTNSNSYGYEFNIIGTDSGQTFRLNRRLDTKVYTFAPTAGNNDGVAVTNFFQDYTPGDTITMSIKGAVNEEGNVVLNCYATLNGETKTIFENVVDDTASKITSGSPGIKINKPNATVTNILVNVEENMPKYLYKDNYDNETSYIKAYGNYDGFRFAYSTGFLTRGTASTCETKFNGIKDSETLENYTMSADMSYGFGAGKFHRITAYGSKNTGYEFGLINDNTKGPSFSLYRRGTTTAKSATLGAVTSISEFFAADDGSFANDVFDLSMTVNTKDDGVHITCTATYNGESKVIFSDVLDNSANKFTSGAPGIRCNDNVSTTPVKIDNIVVMKVAENVPAPGPTPEPEQPVSVSIPYEDTFSETEDTLKKKWTADSNVSFLNETAVLNATSMYLKAADDLAKWHTYVCEAEVTMTNVEIKDINVQTAGIVVAANPNSQNAYQGYEVTLLYDETVNKGAGAYYVRIYDRATKANKMQEIDFYQKGEKATLKVEISDNKINCYVNNKTIITGYTVSGVEKLSGTVGFISSGNQAIVDKLSVKAYAPYSEECKLPFSEQFDNSDAIYYRWNHGALLTVSDEKAVLDNNTTRNTYLTGFEEALEWKNYIYEADVILTDTAFADTSIQSAAIVAAANNKNKGYEFGFFMENGSYQVRLYDRIKGKSLAVTEWYYELNEPSKLTMIISGNAIQCYVDGELVIEEWVEGVTELKGTIGMFASGNEAVFDNLKVDTFTSKIVKKEITAPVADANGIYYTDDFEKGIYLDDNKWPSTVLDLSKGRAAVSGTKGILYLTGDESYLLLKDYVVEARTVISAENDFELRDAVGAIVARTTGEKTGYEFGIVCSEDSAYVRLYDRTTGTELAKNSDIPIEVGKEYLLTMVCEGNTITCYVDGVCAFAVKDNTNASGTAGFRTIGTVYYDDLVVADTSYAIRVVSYSPVTGDNNRNIYMFVIVMIAMSTVCVLTLRYKKLKCCNEVGGKKL